MTSRLCIYIHLHMDVCFDWRMIVSFLFRTIEPGMFHSERTV